LLRYGYIDSRFRGNDNNVVNYLDSNSVGITKKYNKNCKPELGWV